MTDEPPGPRGPKALDLDGDERAGPADNRSSPSSSSSPFSAPDDEWERELAAWDASIPVVVGLTSPRPSWPTSGGQVSGDPALSVVPPGPGREVLGLEDLPDVMSGATLDGTLARSAPGIFDRDPPPEASPSWSSEILPEMTADWWRGDLRASITLGAEGSPRTPAPGYWEVLGQILAGERAATPPAERSRSIALGLGAARIADQLGRLAEARSHLEAALSVDAANPAAHRAMLGLLERAGPLVDPDALRSLAQLADEDHPDQPYYRALQAESVLSRAALGEHQDPGAVTAAVSEVPEGLGRLLAEAEISWGRPKVAAGVLAKAGNQAQGSVGAALMACAAALNEAARDFHTAALQRLVATRLDEGRALPWWGVLRDLARREPEALVLGIEELLPRLPPSSLKVAVARWGAEAARRAGKPARAWRLVSHPAALGPITPGLARDRLDLWKDRAAADHAPSGPPGETALEAPEAPDAAASLAALVISARDLWGTPVAPLILALRACGLASSPDELGFALARAEDAVGGAADGARGMALAPAVEEVARRAAEGPRLRALGLWRRIDPARWLPASLELAEALTATVGAGPSRGEGDPGEKVLEEIAARDPASPAFWTLAARALSRGRYAEAAAHLDRGRQRPAWRQSALAAPLAELAAEVTARADLAAAASRLTSSRGKSPQSPAQRQTLLRILRRLGDRDLWTEYVDEEMAGGSPDRPSERESFRRASLLVEPVFWRADLGEGDDVPSLVSAALDAVPLHPVAFGLALGDRPDPAMLIDRLAAGRSGPGGDRWILTAAIAAAASGDAPRALALAREVGVGRVASPSGLARRPVDGGGPAPGLGEALAATLRRLQWAAPGTAARSSILSELARPDAPADWLLVAAESLEDGLDPNRARDLFESAAVAPGHALVLADIRAGLARLSSSEPDPDLTGSVPPVTANTTATAAASIIAAVPGDSEPAAEDWASQHVPRGRLDLLRLAVRSERWDQVVATLVVAPLHEEIPGEMVLSLAAAIDEGRCQGRRAPEIGVLAQAALIRSAAARPGHNAASESTLWLRVGDSRTVAPQAAAVALEHLARAAARLNDHRSAALFLVEAAHLATSVDDAERAAVEGRRLRAAVSHDPSSALAALAWRRWLWAARRIDEAALAAAAEAEALVDPSSQVRALLRASEMLVPALGQGAQLTASDVAGLPGDRIERAAALLHRGLKIAPRDQESFTRLRDLYEATDRHGALAVLLGTRLEITSNPFEVTALRLARADLLAGPLDDHLGAQAELQAVLQKEPHHARALARLCQLEEADGHDAAVAELLIRRAFIERSPEELRDLFLRLGRIYTQRIPDAKRAVGAYARVLQLDPENREALDELSDLYVGLGETKSAVSITERLVAVEIDPERRSRYHMRLGQLAERGNDPRAVAYHLRRAAEEAPRDTEAMGELVRYLERTRDSVGRRAYLDRTAGELRAAVLADPSDGAAIEALATVLRWRGRAAAAAAAVELSALVRSERRADHAQPRKSSESWRLDVPGWAAPPIGGRRLSALANPAIDDQTFPDTVPTSVRHLFRLLGPALWEGKADLSRHGVDRADRVGAGRPPRDVFEIISGELDAGPFDLYVSGGSHTGPGSAPLTVEPGKPPAIILTGALLRLGGPALRFAAGRALRLISTHLDIALAGETADFGAWLGGVIRQFLPDYHHPEVPAYLLEARTARVAKLMPRRLRQEVMPFAMESSGELDLEELRVGIRDAANRVGLLASGSLVAGLRVVASMSGAALDSGVSDPERPSSPSVAVADVATEAARAALGALAANAEARSLLIFGLSDEYDDLVKSLE